MPDLSDDTLARHLLKVLEPYRSAPVWHVGFSGGLDSTVLLHLLVALRDRHALPPLRAIHVHHGLQAAADAWPEHCQGVCRRLGVELVVERVSVAAGASVEQAARDARYKAFARHLPEHGLLLLGQHRDDQAETVLFRLLRGSGLRGLGGMAFERPLGQGRVVRPLLDVGRPALEACAVVHGAEWIEDPSNQDDRYDRNFLRLGILPQLKGRWSGAVEALARGAGHLREAQGLLDELAAMDLAQCRLDSPWGCPALSLRAVRGLSGPRQRNLLQYWLSPCTRLPDTRHWAGWESLRDAAGDALPCWKLADGELHRSGDGLWWLQGEWLSRPAGPVAWQASTQCLTLPGNGRVMFEGARPDGPLWIDYRQGGEVLAIAGRGHRDLKRWLNEQGVPAFVRGRLPLLMSAGGLLAVANLPLPAQSIALRWIMPTSAQGLR